MKTEIDSRDIGALLRSFTPRTRPQQPGRKVRPRASRGHQTRITKMSKRQPVTIPKTTRTFDSTQHGTQAYDDSSSNLRRLISDPSSVVIAVHGCCAANGSPSAKASYGVFVSAFAINLNRSGFVPDPFQQTSQSAELYATMKALDVVHDLIIAGEDLSHVVIKTNSSYLEKGLSSFIWKWAGNGFKNWRGEPVVNGRAFRFLHERVVLLEKEYGTRVSFCLVRKDQNAQANELARSVLV